MKREKEREGEKSINCITLSGKQNACGVAAYTLCSSLPFSSAYFYFTLTCKPFTARNDYVTREYRKTRCFTAFNLIS